jgi:hypothetical protein
MLLSCRVILGEITPRAKPTVKIAAKPFGEVISAKDFSFARWLCDCSS